MAWTDSRMFRAWVQDAFLLDPAGGSAVTGYTNLEANTLKAALFNNAVVPDRDATAANSGYNTGTWLVAEEKSDGTNWDAGGEPVTGKAITQPAAGVNMFDATDTPQGGASTTLSDVHGCLVYNDTVTATPADRGVTFHYFGGAQSVTAGSFTIIWHADGLFRITV